MKKKIKNIDKNDFYNKRLKKKKKITKKSQPCIAGLL